MSYAGGNAAMITLQWKATISVPVEAECITPENLAEKSPAQIARLPVLHGNRTDPLGEFFDVSGDAGGREVVLEGDCSRVKWIGASMRSGRITIHGDVGMHLGSNMIGGSIVVDGNAGGWVGAEMRGGLIHVHGNAEHQVGAAYRGSRKGMTGGTILVDGSAGNEIGGTMRRGMIAIGGDARDFAGVSMIAGSIFLFGRAGVRTGAGMKRGTIAAFGPGRGKGDLELLPTFRYDCLYRPTFMQLYLRQLAAWGFAPAGDHLAGFFQRHSGDLVALGKGEILVWTP